MVQKHLIHALIILGLVLSPLLGLLPVVGARTATNLDAAGSASASESDAVAFPDFEHVVIDDNPLATHRITDIQIGDINGDGLPDVWTAGRGEGANADQMVWYENPSWSRYTISPGDYMYGNLGDFDGDGDLDVVAGQFDDNRIYWFENTGSPEQGDWPKSYLGVSPWADLVLVGDIDKDGRLDVVYLYKDEWGWAKNPVESEE